MSGVRVVEDGACAERVCGGGGRAEVEVAAAGGRMWPVWRTGAMFDGLRGGGAVIVRDFPEIGAVAQLGEHRVCNAGVASSILVGSIHNARTQNRL